MKIIVGSTNPVKIAAAQNIFSFLDPNPAVEGRSVPSGVPDQPWGDEETQRGAINRAKAALAGDADFGVGFEGGLLNTPHGVMTCAWCAVAGPEGAVGLGGGVNILLPPPVAEVMLAGGELGPEMDKLTGGHDTKQGPGAVGILTDGLIDRQQAYEHMLKLALAPFRTPDFYRNNP